MGHAGPPSGPSCTASIDASDAALLEPRRRVLVVLAKALTDALDSGDVSGARAIARALLVLVEELPNDAGGGSRS